MKFRLLKILSASVVIERCDFAVGKGPVAFFSLIDPCRAANTFHLAQRDSIQNRTFLVRKFSLTPMLAALDIVYIIDADVLYIDYSVLTSSSWGYKTSVDYGNGTLLNQYINLVLTT